MARIALQLAGGIIGGLLALPSGGMSVALGFSLGSIIGGVAGAIIFPGGQNVVGPRMADMTVSSSSNGSPIPFGAGRYPIGGQVIWATPLQEHTKTSSAKGGPTQTTYSYSVSFAVSFGKGPGQILQLWANNKLIYDVTGKGAVSPGDAFTPTCYRGVDSQGQDPTILADRGAANTPAFRDLIYCVFTNLPLDNYANTIPNISALVSCGDVAQSYPVDNALLTQSPQGIIPDWLTGEAYLTQSSTSALSKVSSILQTLADGATIGSSKTLSPQIDAGVLYTPLACVDSDGNVWIGGGSGDTHHIYALDPNAFAVLHTLDLGGEAWALNAYSPNGAESLIAAFVNVSGSLGVARVHARTGLQAGFAYFALPTGAAISIGSATFAQHLPVIDKNGCAYFIAYDNTGSHQWWIWRVNLAVDPDSGTFTDIKVFSFTGDASVGMGRAVIENSQTGTLIVTTTTGAFHVVDSATGTILATHGNAAAPMCYCLTSREMFDPLTCAAAIRGSVPANGIFFAGGRNASDGSATDSLLAYSATDFSLHATYWPSHWIDGTDTSLTVLDWKYVSRSNSLLVTLNRHWPTTGSPEYAVLNLYLDRQPNDGPVFSIAEFITSLCVQAGIDASLVDTSAIADATCGGYPITQPQDMKSTLAALTQFGVFDFIESDFTIKVLPRGATPVVTIPEEDLGLEEDKTKITETLGPEDDISKSTSVSYLDPDLDYQQGSQRKLRHDATTSSQTETVLSSPLVMTADQAAQMADKYLWLPDAERMAYSFNLWKALYMLQDPCDVIAFEYEGMTFVARITGTNIGKNYAVEVTGVSANAKAYLSEAAGIGNAAFQKSTVKTFGPTLLFVWDLPLLQDTDSTAGGGSGFYYAFASPVSAWPGAVLLSSSDNATWTNIAFHTDLIAYGAANTTLGSTNRPWCWDYTNTITVFMAKGAPSSVAEIDVLNGANSAIIGSEVIQFQNAVQNTDGSWTLSKLLRGRRGTEAAISTHTAGERIYFPGIQAGLHRAPVSSSLIGLLRYIKAITVGADTNSQDGQAFTLAGNDLKPYSPVHIQGARDGSLNLTITWTRRTRLGGDADYQDVVTDVPLSEASEAYQVDILNGSTVVRTIAVTAATASYSAANQTTDFGSAQSSLSIKIYQISATVGRGFPGSATV